MAPYRIYFCSRDRKVFASNDFEAKDDAAAVDHGRRLPSTKRRTSRFGKRAAKSIAAARGRSACARRAERGAADPDLGLCCWPEAIPALGMALEPLRIRLRQAVVYSGLTTRSLRAMEAPITPANKVADGATFTPCRTGLPRPHATLW